MLQIYSVMIATVSVGALFAPVAERMHVDPIVVLGSRLGTLLVQWFGLVEIMGDILESPVDALCATGKSVAMQGNIVASDALVVIETNTCWRPPVSWGFPKVPFRAFVT